ncbi:MAG: glycosyltransferase family 39 protein, partial [Anaerohalosphaera sp.]|nr:glycosyltransferase family 39 protein [Anaerohalosphaera sp.]
MARNKKKHIVAPKQTIKEDRTYAFIRFIPIILALILAGIPFMLGKYMELNTPGPFDSGSYVQSAMNILDGAQYGVDEISSARPGTLLVNIIGVKLFGYNDVGPKIVQALMQLAAFCLMFYTLKRTYGSAPAVVGVFIASFYLSAPVICKFGNVKEQYMIALVIITACGFILRQIGRRWWWLVIAGAAMINIYYFKATGLSVAIAIFVHLIAVLITKRRSV